MNPRKVSLKQKTRAVEVIHSRVFRALFPGEQLLERLIVPVNIGLNALYDFPRGEQLGGYDFVHAHRISDNLITVH